MGVCLFSVDVKRGCVHSINVHTVSLTDCLHVTPINHVTFVPRAVFYKGRGVVCLYHCQCSSSIEIPGEYSISVTWRLIQRSTLCCNGPLTVTRPISCHNTVHRVIKVMTMVAKSSMDIDLHGIKVFLRRAQRPTVANTRQTAHRPRLRRLKA